MSCPEVKDPYISEPAKHAQPPVALADLSEPQSPKRLPVTFIKAQLMTERDVQTPDPDHPFPKLLGGRPTSELSPSYGGPENLH